MKTAVWQDGVRIPVFGSMKPGLAPTKQPSMNDIHWAAGFVEGEAAITKRKDYPGQPRLMINQKDIEPLQKCRDLFGGALKQYKYEHGDYWVWTLTGPRARGFLFTVYSLLSMRRKQQIKDCF